MHLSRSTFRLLVAVLLVPVICLTSGLAVAEGAGGFTFKRVKPPGSGATKRINIQVEKTWPHETDPPQAALPAQPAEPTGDWFWDSVSTDLDAADPARLGIAMTVINRNPADAGGLAPDLAMLDTIYKEFGAQILMATSDKRISPAFILAVIAVESSGRPAVVSEKGAQGLMQLIPETARRFGVKDANNPLDNIRGGAAYLDWLFDTFKGDPILSLAGYNAGENAVLRNKGVPPYAETRAYIPKVLAAWDKTRLYCQTMPRFADDGCVFALNRSLAN